MERLLMTTLKGSSL